MYSALMIFVVMFPIVMGAFMLLIPFKSNKLMHFYLQIIVTVNSIATLFLLFNRNDKLITAINFTGNLSISFRIDELSVIFAALIALLWPFANMYAIEYMKHEKRTKIFFMFYTMTYGVTLGIAMSANLITMYLFYELLTLVTLPLVMHALSRESILASRKYLYYSLGGAAFAFIGVVFLIVYGQTSNFVWGGVLTQFNFDEGIVNKLLIIYLITFLGFGVKAAVLPFNSWLPEAGVAPTPVTALLHAVAVVKAGAFAIIRITYYSFGVKFLKGTWAQDVVMVLVIATIVYGCSMALKETHFKRRLAYSTISNLSYILFGAVLMTPLGLVGALLHMIAHAVTKITSFFCAGSIMHQTGKHYIHQLDGLGKKLPIVCAIFTFSSFALMGVPLTPAFISKWNLAFAAIKEGGILSIIGVVALLISALLTAIYMLTIVVRFYFPTKDEKIDLKDEYHDPNYLMIIPLITFVGFMICYGFFAQDIIDFITNFAVK